MEPEYETPQPTSTESDGTQETAKALATATITPPQLQRLTPVQAMEGLMAANPSRFGGVVSGTLLLSHVSLLTADRDEAKNEQKETQREIKELRGKLATADTRIAVLEERAGSASTKTRLVGLCAFLAPVLAGIAIETYKSGLVELTYIIGGVSAVMLAVAALLMWGAGK